MTIRFVIGLAQPTLAASLAVSTPQLLPCLLPAAPVPSIYCLSLSLSLCPCSPSPSKPYLAAYDPLAITTSHHHFFLSMSTPLDPLRLWS